MVKGFSESEVKNNEPLKDSKKVKRGLASFLQGKKFTYTKYHLFAWYFYFFLFYLYH